MITVSHSRSIESRIRDVVQDHARLGSDRTDLSESDDLYDAGMTSHASVNLMLALENEFDVEFPDELLTRSVFSSIASIKSAILRLLPDGSEHDSSETS